MAVGAQQDFHARPVSADLPQQPAQEGFDLLTARALGGTQHGGNEPPLAVEHDDRLEAVLIVMGVEQRQLLAAVHRVERVVEIERDALRRGGERGAVESDHRPAHAEQSARVRQVLQPGDRRLRAQIALRRRQIERHLEHGIAAKRVGVYAVLIAGGDHQQAEAHDVGEAVRDLSAVARIDETGRKPIRDAKPLFDLAQRQHAAVRRQQATIESDIDALASGR